MCEIDHEELTPLLEGTKAEGVGDTVWVTFYDEAKFQFRVDFEYVFGWLNYFEFTVT